MCSCTLRGCINQISSAEQRGTSDLILAFEGGFSCGKKKPKKVINSYQHVPRWRCCVCRVGFMDAHYSGTGVGHCSVTFSPTWTAHPRFWGIAFFLWTLNCLGQAQGAGLCCLNSAWHWGEAAGINALSSGCCRVCQPSCRAWDGVCLCRAGLPWPGTSLCVCACTKCTLWASLILL